MAFRNDGGNFSKDLFAQLLAKKAGSISNDELAEQEKIPQEAIDMASGTIGSVKPINKLANLPNELNLMDRIRQAILKSKIKGPKGGLTTAGDLGSVTGPVGGLVEHNMAPMTSSERELAFGKVTSPEGGLTNNASEFQKVMPDYNPATDQNLDRLKRLKKMLKGEE